MGYTAKAKRAIEAAQRATGRQTLALALALVEEGGYAAEILRRYGVSADGLQRAAKQGENNEREGEKLTRIVAAACERACRQGEDTDTHHLLAALCAERRSMGERALRLQGVEEERVEDILRSGAFRFHREVEAPLNEALHRPRADKLREESYGTDLTALAEAGKIDPVIGREGEIAQVIEVLLRRTKNNPVLVGAPGVGKTAIAEGLAARIAAGTVPDALKGKRVFALDVGKLVAGTKYRGDMEERLNDALAQHLGDVLFLDEMHVILSAGDKEGGMTAANLLKPLLARGEVSVIGATTEQEYRRYILRDGALERRFRPVRVLPPTTKGALEILKGLKERYESHHGVTFSEECLSAAVELSAIYLPARCLPDKAIDLLDESAAYLRLQSSSPDTEEEEAKRQIRAYADAIERAVRREDYREALEYQQKSEELSRKIKTNGVQSKGRPLLEGRHIAATLARWTGSPEGEIALPHAARIARLKENLRPHCDICEIDGLFSALAEWGREGAFPILVTGERAKTARWVSAFATGYSGETPLAFEGARYRDPAAPDRLFGQDGARGELLDRVTKRPLSVPVFDDIELFPPALAERLIGVETDCKEGDLPYRPLAGRVVLFTLSTPDSAGFRLGSAGENRVEQVRLSRAFGAALAYTVRL